MIFPSHNILHPKLRRDPEVEVGCQLSCVRQYRLGVNVEVYTPCRGGTVSETETQDISAHTTASASPPKGSIHTPIPRDKRYTYSAFRDIDLSHSYTTATPIGLQGKHMPLPGNVAEEHRPMHQGMLSTPSQGWNYIPSPYAHSTPVCLSFLE